MRMTKKTTAGAILLAALTLAGCSGTTTETTGSGDTASTADATAATSTSESSAPAAESAVNCPTLAEGATVESDVLGGCVAKAVMGIAGYASTGLSMGMETSAQWNDGGKEVAITTVMGSIISLNDKAWVQPTGGAWAVADEASTDPTIAGLSQAASSLGSLDLAATMSSLTGTLTVTGTDTRLGEKVFVLTGEQSASGVTAQSTYYVTSDWAPLETSQEVDASGTPVVTNTIITEWDEKQDIQPPM